MFTAFALTMAIGAPVPITPAPAPAGVAPRVMELKANADGKVTVMVTRTEKVQVGVGAAIAPAAGGGAAPPAVITREVPVTKMIELSEVKDLVITTADGKKLTTEEAMKKIADGAIVVVSGDGKPVSPAFLKVFKDETLVLAAPELAAPTGGVMYPGGRPIIRPLPVNPPGGPAPAILPAQPGVVQIQPGVIQIQIAPGALPAVPALPVVPAKPAETKPAEKPPVGQ
jgi:hypothetical protein